MRERPSYVIVDNIEREVDYDFLMECVNDNFSDYDKKAKHQIYESILFLLSDLETEKEYMDGKEPEEYYTGIVKLYLDDGHSVYDLVNCEDDGEIYRYIF